MSDLNKFMQQLVMRNQPGHHLKLYLHILSYLTILIGFFCSSSVQARSYFWRDPLHQVILGKPSFYVAEPGETYAEIAAKTDVAYDNLNAANPGVGPRTLPLDQIYQPHAGTVLVLPTQVLLPMVPHRGVVVNIAEKRLYYFRPKQHRVYVYPIGVGRANWVTPEGYMFIAQKIKNPVWIVPDSIMKYRQQRGDPINKIIQSGPDNPLGYFAMRLSNPTYLMHGTNEPAGVGRRSSAGCIRMYAQDIKELFHMMQLKTPVHIINMPFKVVADEQQKEVWVSLHPPFSEHVQLQAQPLQQLQELFKKYKLQSVFINNKQDLVRHLKLQTGLPFLPSGEVMSMLGRATW